MVSVIVSKDLSKLDNNAGASPFDFFGNNFPFSFEVPKAPVPEGIQQVGGGTGFVIDSGKGLVLTNRHVVNDEDASYTVVTNEGKIYDAEVVARDQVNDLALIKIQANALPAVELGDSDDIQLGQTVIAIGNALGEYSNTITKGVISGIDRNVIAGDGRGLSENLEGVFQTDAAINPGNSGGPLVNLFGQVIGINTAINREGQLIGFSIPINEAKRLVSSFEKYGRVVRAFLGVRYVNITPVVVKKNNLTVDHGALIIKGADDDQLAIIPGSPADKAGLVENDIILEVNGEKVEIGRSLVKLIGKYDPGQVVKLKILRLSEEKELSVKLEEFKDVN